MVVEEVTGDGVIAHEAVSEKKEVVEIPPVKEEVKPEPKTEVSQNKPEVLAPEPPPYAKESRKFNLLWILIPGLLLLGLLMGGIFAYYKGINNLNTPSTEATSTPVASPVLTPTPTPLATTKLDLTKYPVAILNGSGIAGEAGKVKTLLQTAGFTIASTANAKTYDFEKTEVSVKTGVDAAFVEALVTALNKNYQVDDPKTVSTQSASVVVTVGTLKAR